MSSQDLASDNFQENVLNYFDGTQRKVLSTDIETEFPDGCLIVSPNALLTMATTGRGIPNSARGLLPGEVPG